jgi:flavin-dependent dehydrogenase
MDETAVAVVGAGPHGLAAAAHLRRAGTGYQVLDPAPALRVRSIGGYPVSLLRGGRGTPVSRPQPVRGVSRAIPVVRGKGPWT